MPLFIYLLQIVQLGAENRDKEWIKESLPVYSLICGSFLEETSPSGSIRGKACWPLGLVGRAQRELGRHSNHIRLLNMQNTHNIQGILLVLPHPKELRLW